ncbi:unnamed protein product [Linum trigynum]|uniref:Uncharacterized protein n=1 Tax=Linum trigynum TaxID=586398 RepID=A0AAV2GNI0_9ROSI
MESSMVVHQYSKIMHLLLISLGQRRHFSGTICKEATGLCLSAGTRVETELAAISFVSFVSWQPAIGDEM